MPKRKPAPDFSSLPPPPTRKERTPREPPKVEPLSRMPNEPDPEWLKQQAEQDEREAQLLAEAEERLYQSDGSISAAAGAAIRSLLAEKGRRKIEALNLYEPLPAQMYFHASRARVRLLRGSNRGGKTLPAAVEVARAATGRDPCGKYVTSGGRFFCVGKDLTHVGQVMWRKLGRAGAFRIIRDEHTKAWRAFRPWQEYDAAHREKSKEAPPLIPPRMIEKVGWENKAEGIPNLVKLTTGWELSFFSSLGKPPQGSDIDGCWFDEEIVNQEWYPEMVARLIDRMGMLVWSATPQAGTDQLFELHEQAERERAWPRPYVQEYVILLAHNPHIAEQAKKDFAATLSEEDVAVRVGGEFAIQSFKVYPTFSMHLHGCKLDDVPSEWTRYLVVDPGHQVCAVLFAAVPPPPCDQVYLYDELYLRECDAAKFADAVMHKAVGVVFQSFLIDPHMAVHTELGVGLTVGDQYAAALRARHVASVSTGSQFLLACDDVAAGLTAVRGWLRVREDGTTKLRVLEGRLPNFEWEIKRYNRKREGGVVTDKPNQRKNCHLMDCLRYLALHDPRYAKPPAKKGRLSGAIAGFREKQRRQRERDGGGKSMNLGPGKVYA